MKSAEWYVYMVRCNDSSLYTGIAKDLNRRVAQHNSKKGGAKYTRARQPVELVYFEYAESRAAAARREWQIKKLSVNKKHMLVGSAQKS